MDSKQEKEATVLVDFDGVISANAVELAIDFIHGFLNRYRAVPLETVRTFTKQTLSFRSDDTLLYYFRSLGLQSEIPRFREEYAQFDRSVVSELSIDEGFWRFDEHCVQAGRRFFVLSLASPQRLEALGALRAGVIYSIPQDSKCDPSTFQRILSEIGATAERTLYIDDSPLALAAAHSLGITTVHMQNGMFGPKDSRLYQQHIDHCVQTWPQFSAVAEGFINA